MAARPVPPQVVLVSSMGICDAENRLNKIGGGNILIWKRRAEKYLISRGFPSYTIIHPGGLLDAPARHVERRRGSEAVHSHTASI
jgi:hypothetical protein